MFTKFRNLLAVFGIFALALAFHGQEQVRLMQDSLDTAYSEYAKLEERQNHLLDQVNEANCMVEELRAELQKADALMADLFSAGKYGEFSHEQWMAVGEIKRKTPLSDEAAAALVYYSDYYGIDYSLILSIVEVESNFDPYLVGTSQDRGLMQIIPTTEKYLVDAFGSSIGIEYDPSRIFDPDYNLGLGISYIAYLHGIHGDDRDKILTEYNRGAGGLAAYYAAHSTYSSTYSRAVIDRTHKYRGIGSGEE